MSTGIRPSRRGEPLKNSASLRLGICILLAGLATFVQRSAEASSLAETQLAGLKGVNLIVSVDRDLSGADALGQVITEKAKEILAQGGLSHDGPDGVWLSILVKLHPSDEKLRPEDVLIQVRVELSEHVRLNRDRSIKVPQGAITWSEDSVRIKSKAEVRESVLKQVDWAVGLFTDTVKSVRRLSDKDVRNPCR
jgi:hypothetical protein